MTEPLYRPPRDNEFLQRLVRKHAARAHVSLDQAQAFVERIAVSAGFPDLEEQRKRALEMSRLRKQRKKQWNRTSGYLPWKDR